eukprot:CAMPEP_0202962164 /NCGR_PEP_ID=MMETSP1396-20130829/6271_1 /ASSEMBLY_ACC=CAM_ASM_000872 /TAXON_ID= /ORGANISM="Pseudokeronopsis sp., Strain Brazil" /LENGTH=38 /DNA_ID= /DNA_START= /DNA_END= /DNA_ORIENTATION=
MFVGVPEEKKIDEFLRTADVVSELASNKEVMDQFMKEA